jgi:hypothetical protein
MDRKYCSIVTVYCVLLMLGLFLLFYFSFSTFRTSTVSTSVSPINYTLSDDITNFCSPNVLDMPDHPNNICYINSTINIRICLKRPLYINCVILTDFDFEILCKNLPKHFEQARSYLDGLQ